MPLNVQTYEAPELLGDLLLFEVDPQYCRETVDIVDVEIDLPRGTVMVKTADGHYIPWGYGDEDAAGILLCDLPARPHEPVRAPLLRRFALVNAAALRWPEGVSDAQKAVALFALETLGIFVKEVQPC